MPGSGQMRQEGWTNVRWFTLAPPMTTITISHHPTPSLRPSFLHHNRVTTVPE